MGLFLPVSIRTNNPGAQWYGPIATMFGATGSENLSDGNNAAVFPDPISGAAAQFALLTKRYSGMPLNSAIAKWSGGNSSPQYTNFLVQQTGLSPQTVLTRDLLQGPQGLALAKAQAHWEAGRPYPMTDADWKTAQARAFGQQSGVQLASYAPPQVPHPTSPIQLAAAQSPVATQQRPPIMPQYQQQPQPGYTPSYGSPSGFPGVGNPFSGFLGGGGGFGNGAGGLDFGTRLRLLGAGLTSIMNPAGGAAMANAAMIPLLRQRFAITYDKLGRPYRVDVHTGQATPLFAGAPSMAGGSAYGGVGGGGMVAGPPTPMVQGSPQVQQAPQGSPQVPQSVAQSGGSLLPYLNPPNQAQQQDVEIANSPLGMQERAKALTTNSVDTVKALNESAVAAQKLKQLTEEMLQLEKDPHLSEGGLGEHMQAGKSALASFGIKLPGTVTGDIYEKDAGQLQALWMKATGGMQRIAGPEIKFSAMANPTLAKTHEARVQILKDLHSGAQFSLDAAKLANLHQQTYNTLGSQYYNDFQKLAKQTPFFKLENPPQEASGGASQASGEAQAAPQQQQAPYPGAQLAPDGKWYVKQNGKYFRVD